MERLDAIVSGGQLVSDPARAVRRVVVDDEQSGPWQGVEDRWHDRGQILGFVVRGHDYPCSRVARR